MKCENISNLPLSIYILKVKYHLYKLEIVDFKLLNYANKTQYKNEEFTPDLIYKNINKKDFQYLEKNFLKLIKKPFIEIYFSFKFKNLNIFF